jgi:hypothetical protein
MAAKGPVISPNCERRNMYRPVLHKYLVDRWRELATLPADIEDIRIFNIVDMYCLQYTSLMSPEEKAKEIEFLRRELGLPWPGATE